MATDKQVEKAVWRVLKRKLRGSSLSKSAITPERKFISIIEEKIKGTKLELIQAELASGGGRTLYIQPPKLNENLAVAKFVFKASSVYAWFCFGNQLYVNGKVDWTRSIKEEDCPYCDQTTGRWVTDYGDDQGIKKLLSVLGLVLREVAPPMGPFLPKTIIGCLDYGDSDRTRRELSHRGFKFGEELMEGWYHAELPKDWSKLWVDADPKDTFSRAKVFLLDGNKHRRASMDVDSTCGSLLFINRYYIRASDYDYSGIARAKKATIFDNKLDKEIASFEESKSSFRGAEEQAKEWLRNHCPHHEDHFKAWES